jgi:hypothetical protein
LPITPAEDIHRYFVADENIPVRAARHLQEDVNLARVQVTGLKDLAVGQCTAFVEDSNQRSSEYESTGIITADFIRVRPASSNI